MRITRDFYARSASEQRWFTQNTWCEACHEADLGLNNPVEYEEVGVVYVSGNCRKCDGAVTSVVSEVNESPSPQLQRYSVVRVRQLVQSSGSYGGWRENQRPPEIGDTGAIVEVLNTSGLPSKYVVESCAKDGSTLWLCDFYAEELELASSRAA
jgi:hypothetical protein